MQKLLLIGAKKNYNAEYFYSRAFASLGYDVLHVNSYEGVAHPLLSRLAHTRVSFFNANFYLNRRFQVNKTVLELARNFDPDFIMVFKGEFISNTTLEGLSRTYNTYLFYPDMYKFKPLLKNRLRLFKAVFTAANRKEFYYKLGARRVVTVPWACDPELHRKIETRKIYDVSFVGTAYRERKKMIDNINGVSVFGDFWDRKLYFFKGHDAKKKVFPPVFGEDYIRVINQSKISLNLQAKANIVADAPTMRTFEVAGCGGFQLSDYLPSLAEYFPFVPTYKTVGELKEFINYYLTNDAEREEIAIKSQEKCYKFYKYTDAAAKIVSNL